MIHIQVSAVCRVWDGCTGRLLPPGGLRCTLDGALCRPVSKKEGYLVLTGLAAGTHRLVLEQQGYQPEWVEFAAGAGEPPLLNVTMKPGAGYPLAAAVWLSLQLFRGEAPAAERLLWLAPAGREEWKVAQPTAEAGSLEVRLFWKGRQTPRTPGDYLLLDGKHSELVELRTMEGERGVLGAPLVHSHKRGTLLLGAQRCHTDGTGALRTALPEPGTVEVYDPETGLLDSLSLSQGENVCQISLPAPRKRG